MSNDNRIDPIILDDSTDDVDNTTYSKPSRSRTRRQEKKLKRQQKMERRSTKHKVIKRIFEVIVCLGIVGVISVVGMVAFVIFNTPPINAEDINSRLKLSSTIYDDAGQPIKNIYMGDGERELVTYDQIPKTLVDAFVSVEDKTFWTHHGFNLTRIVGAVWESVKGGGQIGGTSTITQQLARNVFLTEKMYDHDYQRKIQEAYYAIQLERQLSKEEIITAYLNTIYLGNRSYGINTAVKGYFNKPLDQLDPLECATLASLPKAPSAYEMIKIYSNGQIDQNNPEIKVLQVSDSGDVYVYNGKVEARAKLILGLMKEQGYLTDDQYNQAMESNLQEHIHPTILNNNGESSFFVDYAIDQVADDLLANVKGLKDRDEAMNMIHNGGLDIYTTLNKEMQAQVDEKYANRYNFPGTILNRQDNAGNIMVPSQEDANIAGNSVMLYKASNLFDEGGNFYLHEGEYEMQENGDMVLVAGHRLNFYDTNGVNEAGEPATDINIEFKNYYTYEDEQVYTVAGGIISIPQKYKSRTENNNVRISASLFAEHPEMIQLGGERPVIPPTSFTLRQKIVQPQSACTILENDTGFLKAMAGGRDIKGQKAFNRATDPRQPGSSIKPIAVYAPALEMGAKKEAIGAGEKSWGEFWTTLSVIDDKQITYEGKPWPKNWYSGFRGNMTFRKALQQSVNTIAVQIQLNIGNERSLNFMKGIGISSIVESGDRNDMNPGAMALGGMSNGISTLEMSAAYGAFANGGTYMRPLAYSKVVSKSGKEILVANNEGTKAMDPATAYIMNDIMKSNVEEGLGKAAAISGTPVAGKTGTTDDQCDVWFVGNTPKYSAAFWIGNDSKLKLTDGSGAAANLWNNVMSAILSIGESGGEFREAPANVV
ncbi:MAG: transglycosylase domain-containing protein, partial [Clostridiales Family XIII bacterium]|nr:transglycosylase domain-containing protein [Clostridiales Family XIII bacterium]